MNLEERYFVVNKADALRLPEKDLQTFRALLHQIEGIRAYRGKPFQQYLCIGKDWPEYEPTLKLLSERVDRENEDYNSRKSAQYKEEPGKL